MMSGPGETAENGSTGANNGPTDDGEGDAGQPRDETRRLENEEWAQHDPDVTDPPHENE